MKITIQRNPAPLNGSLFGVLYLDGVRQFPTLENDELKIPLGIFKAEIYFSPHNKRFVIRLINVHDRTEIEIHIANYFHQLLGCVAVGLSRNDTQLISSKLAFDDLMKKVILSEDELEVEII